VNLKFFQHLIRVSGDEEFLEEQVGMMMQLGSPYLGMVNRE
jgi:hypothetical protein